MGCAFTEGRCRAGGAGSRVPSPGHRPGPFLLARWRVLGSVRGPCCLESKPAHAAAARNPGNPGPGPPHLLLKRGGRPIICQGGGGLAAQLDGLRPWLGHCSQGQGHHAHSKPEELWEEVWARVWVSLWTLTLLFIFYY